MKKQISVFVFLLFTAEVCLGNTIYIPGDYPTIQQGIDAASEGDTVMVSPDTYEESVYILIHNIHLLSSEGAAETVIAHSGSSYTSTLTVANDSEVSGFNIRRNAAYYASATVRVQYGNAYFHHNIIYHDSEGATCVSIENDSSPAFLNNTLHANGEMMDWARGFEITSVNASPTIKNNIVYIETWDDRDLSGIICPEGTPVNHSYNDFFNCQLEGTSWAVGEISDDPQFVNEPSDYHLTAGSPCINAGIPVLQDPDGTSSDMGCFFFAQYAPEITSSPDTVAYTGSIYTYELSATSSAPVMFELLIAPAGMTISYDGIITWNVPAAASEDTVVSIRGYNTYGEDIQTYTLYILESTVSPPVIIAYSPEGLDTAAYREEVEFSITAIDTNGLELYYFWYWDGNLIGSEQSILLEFVQLGDHVVTGSVSNGFLSVTIDWPVFIRGQYISGAVSGVFSAAEGPYIANSTINIAQGTSLTIEPGSRIYLGDDVWFYVSGLLTADGSESDSIFILPDGDAASNGVLLDATSDPESRLSYCRIKSASQCVWGSFCQMLEIEHCCFETYYSVPSGGYYPIEVIYANSVETVRVEDCVIKGYSDSMYLYGIQTHLCDDAYIHGCDIFVRSYTENTISNVTGFFTYDDHLWLVEENTIRAEGIRPSGISISGHEDLTATRNLIEVVGVGSPGSSYPSLRGVYMYALDGIVLTNNTFILEYPNNGIYGVYMNFSCFLEAENNIFYSNNGGFGIYAYQGVVATAEYNDLYGFSTPFHNVNPGPGNITEDPEFAGICFQLLEGSPCIDAGNPASPPDPDGTRVDMGCYYFDQSGILPNVSITLVPSTSPVQIPAGGGSFQFDITLANNTGEAVTFDTWTEVVKPNGQIIPILLRPEIQLPAGGLISRELTQNIPAIAPAGDYIYQGFTGTHPDIIIDSDSFGFEKLTGDGSIAAMNNWGIEGWEDSESPMVILPDKLHLAAPYPNPFNASVALTFALPGAGRVQVTVYNSSGQEVESLCDGFRSAGLHQIAWNAENFSSGMYFIQLTVDREKRISKVILVK